MTRTIAGALMALTLLLTGTPAQAADPAPPTGAEAEAAAEAAAESGTITTPRRGACGLRRHRVSGWQASGAEGATLPRFRTGFGDVGEVSYMLIVNGVYRYCDYRRRPIRTNRVDPVAIEYCVRLLENWESRALRGVRFDGYLSSARRRAHDLVATYVDTDRLDDRGDVNCVSVGTSYLPKRRLRLNPAYQVTAQWDLPAGDKYTKVNRGNQRGIPLNPTTSLRLFPN